MTGQSAAASGCADSRALEVSVGAGSMLRGQWATDCGGADSWALEVAVDAVLLRANRVAVKAKAPQTCGLGLGRFCAGCCQWQMGPIIVVEIYHWRKASVLGMQRPSLLLKRNRLKLSFMMLSGSLLPGQAIEGDVKSD